MVNSTITMIGTSPRWVNSFDSVALRMPGVRQVLGQQLALMTGTGAVSGRLSTTAAQCIRDQGSYVVTSPVRRRWRRNIESVPDVMLLVARGEIPEEAWIVTGDAGRSLLARCLTGQPRPAKLNGVAIDDDVATRPASTRSPLASPWSSSNQAKQVERRG